WGKSRVNSAPERVRREVIPHGCGARAAQLAFSRRLFTAGGPKPFLRERVASMSSLPIPVSLAASLLLGYLLGSIPFGLLLTRAAGTADLRAIGSGNIGATNVLRTGRKDLAAATLLLDAAKGALAVLLGAYLAPAGGVVAAAGAFLGHIFPVWLKFNGGKGVATFLGALFALNWPTGFLFCAVWLSAAAIWRYSSLSALIASAVS